MPGTNCRQNHVSDLAGDGVENILADNSCFSLTVRSVRLLVPRVGQPQNCLVERTSPSKCVCQLRQQLSLAEQEVGLTHVFVLHPLDSESPEAGKYRLGSFRSKWPSLPCFFCLNYETSIVVAVVVLVSASAKVLRWQLAAGHEIHSTGRAFAA